MKTVLVSTLAATAIALSMSSAFALSNSPQGAVIVGGGEASLFTSPSTGHEQASPRHFLSGNEQVDPDFGLSSNAIQGRDFLNAQKGRY